jgi:hypothetical protein
MKTYVRVKDGVVQEVIAPYANEAGREVPIEDRFTPEFVVDLVDVSEVNPTPDQRWTYDGEAFSPPSVYKPSPEETLRLNQAEQAALLASASQAMTPLYLALQLGDDTDQERTAAKAWRSYYQELQSVDLTLESPDWPDRPGASA